MKLFSFFSEHRSQVSEILLNIFCLVVGFIIAYRYFYPAIDMKAESDRIVQIHGEIQKNNQACIQAVESNKNLKKELDEKVSSLSSKLTPPKMTEVKIEWSDQIPASLPIEK